MGLITTKHEIGDEIIINKPGISAQVMGIVYNGYSVSYRVCYWVGPQAVFYEAYDYEIRALGEEDPQYDLYDDGETRREI